MRLGEKMKNMIITLVLFSGFALNATRTSGIICKNDQRMHGGPLKELILTPTPEGHTIQTQYIPSLNSPSIEIETWAEKIPCLFDKSAPLAFCQIENGLTVQFKERREVFYDSLKENAKKKTLKNIEISLYENNENKKSLSFAPNDCEIFTNGA
jgi:hypothetical protein